MGKVNNRIHSTTKRVPQLMLAEEQLRLHPVPAAPHTVTFGETRTVAVNTPMVSYQGGSYSVPHRLLGETVWVRVHGAGRDERIIIVHVGPGGAVEVARHRRAEPGSPKIDDDHFPPQPAGALNREPVPGSAAESAFLALGEGAALWLKEAAAQGTSRIRVKMGHAVSIAKLTTPGRVDWALGHAAVHHRFGEGDLASILTAHPDPAAAPPALRAGETRSLTQGTAGWAALGAASVPTDAPNDLPATTPTRRRATDDHRKNTTRPTTGRGAGGAAAARRRGGVAAPAADAAHQGRRPRRPRDREVATLGTRRSVADPVHR
jgi:hypothetical protein